MRGLLLIPACFSVCLFGQTQPLLERADEAFRNGNFSRAETLARQAVAGDPNAVHGHMILGVIAARRNQWDASNRHFLSVVRLEPSNPHGYFYVGQAKLYQQQWDAAIRYFTQALDRQYPEPDRLMVESGAGAK
jgi:Flp pilus assembly protein TadD